MAGLRVTHVRDFEEAVPLAPAEREAYRRRYATLFVDDTRGRKGGISQVSPALNTQGEVLALKTLLPNDHVGGERLAEALRQEYEAHLALNGLRGFPRLYGFGTVDGSPVIVMEWVRGITLREAQAELAADPDGRIPTLTVATMGRSLFELLGRMGQMGPGVVHRDLSPSNVMVRTDHLTLDQQVREGAFDLCLVDLGSAEPLLQEGDTSLTAATGILRGATADYAPPEMLTHDLPHAERLRLNPAIDVYAAGSILYELMAGRLPYDLHEDARSPYRIKTDDPPSRPQGIHAATHDLERVLAAEPAVATEVAVALLDLAQRPGEEDVRQCLALVDDQLADLVLACLAPEQGRRPTAEAMRSALATFCSCHPDNVRRALAGERLIPCTADAAWFAGTSPLALRRMIRSVGSGVSLGIWCVVVVGTALLVQGTTASLGTTQVTLWAPVVGVMLALPAILAKVATGGTTGSRASFLRGSFVLACCSLVVAALVSQLTFDTAARANGLLAAVLASFTAGWCPLVLDYATTVVPALVREARRRLPAPQAALATSTTRPPAPETSALPTANHPISDDVSYEVPEHGNAE